MPAPLPNAVWIETGENGRPTVYFESAYWGGKSRDRKRRAIAMLRKVARTGWFCGWCKEPIPYFRRVDAEYCCEGCRKRAARRRRKWRCPA